MLFVSKANRRSTASLDVFDESLKRLKTGRSLPRLQTLPRKEDLAQWQAVYRPSRRMARRSSPQPHSTSPIPIISLAKVKAGVRPGKPWFPDMPTMDLSHSYDHSHNRSDSLSRVFPAATASFDSLPPNTDTNEYAASARTAFQSGYLKQSRIRLRLAAPREHPEYAENGQFGKRRDRVVRYRESMLRLRTLVSGRQLLS